MSNKLTIIRDTLLLSRATVIIQGISFGLAIYIRRQLGPEAMGIWALLQVYITYIAYANLGIFGAVYRQIPVLRGAGQHEKVISIKNTAFTYVSISSTVLGIFIILGTFIFRAKLSDPIFYGLITLAIINLLQRANNYQIQILNADKRFELVSRFKIYSALANALFTLVLVWKLRLYGMYAATVCSYLFNIGYLLIAARLKFIFQWKGAELKELLSFSIPLVGLGLATKLLFSVDKLLIGKYFGLKALGIYSIAMMASNYIFTFPSLFYTVLFPNTLETFGNEKQKAGREKYSTVPAEISALYFSLAIAACWIFAPYLCLLLLPNYVGGIPALKVLIFGGCFMSLTQQMSHILLGYKRHLWMIPVILSSCLMAWGGTHLIAALKGNMVHVAALISLFYLINYCICTCFALSPIYTPRRIVWQLTKTILPIAYSALILSQLDIFWPKLTLFSVLLKGVIFLGIWCIPVFYFGKDSRTFLDLKSALGDWRQKKASL